MSEQSRAMSDGKARIQATIVWELHAGPLHLRCRPRPADGSDGFVVEARDAKGWSAVSGGKDALNLLRAIVMLPAVGKAFAK
jgi:hypothetical protein